LFDNIYHNKTALITGHTGFKRSWLAIWLKKLWTEVVGYSFSPPSEPNNLEATMLLERINHVHGAIHDLPRLMKTFKKYQPEIVFHLAAQPIVRLSYDEPKMTLGTNVGCTVSLFEAVRITPSVRVLVNITNDKSYKNRKWAWSYRENDPQGGHAPYRDSNDCGNRFQRLFQIVFQIQGHAPILPDFGSCL
jgi:CDP-glucose 4,6-dehydratase